MVHLVACWFGSWLITLKLKKKKINGKNVTKADLKLGVHCIAAQTFLENERTHGLCLCILIWYRRKYFNHVTLCFCTKQKRIAQPSFAVSHFKCCSSGKYRLTLSVYQKEDETSTGSGDPPKKKPTRLAIGKHLLSFASYFSTC